MRSTHEMYAIAARYRGDVINEISWMERFLDTYIAKHFVNDDPLLLGEMHLLFLGDNRISLESKRQIFHYLANTHDREWYHSYRSIRPLPIKGNAPMSKDLTYVIQQRNVLAHRIVDTSEEGRNDLEKISFNVYKNVYSTVPFSEQIYTELILIIRDLTKHLYDRAFQK